MKKNQLPNKLIAIVGMAGSGKSVVAEEFKKASFSYIRLGQITLDEVKNRGLSPGEKNEQPIREEFRKKHGMGAFAVLNLPKIKNALKQGPVVVDGLYSWSEYKIFRDKFGDNFKVVAVVASPVTRYARLTNRQAGHKKDPAMKYRSFSPAEAQTRDYKEIENIEKGGPIAMGDYYVLNESSLENLRQEIQEVITVLTRNS